MTKNKSFLQAPLYPFLIALAPVVSLYTVNRAALSGFDAIRPAVVCFFVALAAVAASRIFSKSTRSAAILGSFLLFGVGAYGYVFRSVSRALDIEISDSYFLTIWLLLIAGGYAFLVHILRRTQSSLDNVTVIFNIVGVAFIAAAAMPLMLGRVPPDPPLPIQNAEGRANPLLISESLSTQRDSDQAAERLPDVYYLILDGYARGDVLRSRFGFENSNFLGWLQANGFFIGHLSHSNYAWTHLSLSATLNLEYLQTLLPEELKTHGPEPFRQRYQFLAKVLNENYIGNSRVHNFFSDLGYQVFTNTYTLSKKGPTSFVESLAEFVDEFEDALTNNLSHFEEALITHTIVQPIVSGFRIVESVQAAGVSKYDRIIRDLEKFSDAAYEGGPKFVFYHVVSPHQPFCFDENGEMVPRHPVYEVSAWLDDRLALPGYIAWATEKYPRNVSGLNVHVKKAIKRILEASGGNAIVIVQADHGTAFGFDSRSAAGTDVLERFGILNAIYLPPQYPRHGFEESLSSVNTFRLVLRNAFDMDLPALEDRAYYSVGDLNFEDVTQRLLNSE